MKIRQRGPRLALASALCGLFSTSASLGAAQSATPAPDVPAAAAVPTPIGTREPLVQGPFREVAVEGREDAVPAAGEDVVEAGPLFDRLISKAQGDPNFLGFAAGPYYPPAGERIDPQLAQLAARAFDDGRPAGELNAFVMFARRITPERVAELEALGVRTLGFHPQHCLRVALPAQRLGEIAGLEFVRWVGLPREWQKVHPGLARELAASEAQQGGVQELWISLYEDDAAQAPDVPVQFETVDAGRPSGSGVPLAVAPRARGWRERSLEDFGAVLDEYAPTARSFRAHVDRARVADLARLDFVQFLSPVSEAHAAAVVHDESMPMIGADHYRATWTGKANQAVVMGLVDSGMTYTHLGFNAIWGAGWDFTSEGLGPWYDGRKHGSHVAGTMIGRKGVEDSYTGAAPGVGDWGGAGRFFVYKIIDANDSFAGVNWNTLATYMHSGWTDNGGLTTPKPHVLNSSWGHAPTAGGWIGSEPEIILFDNEVYQQNQMHVFAAGNSGPGAGTIWKEASGKNVFSVGAIVDYDINATNIAGTSWTNSSRGPLGDGRWKPNVVAPGSKIRSIKALTLNEYSDASGTSMAAPHVSGGLGQLLDHHSFLRYKPATAAALLMATAITKDDAVITSPGDAHLNQYGAGRVDISRAHYSNSQQDLFFWGWPNANGSSSFEVDVPVPSGATRMTAAFVYYETAASNGANQALVNDWDMWIDAAPFTAAGNSGEYFAHQSSINNVELRTIDSPPANTYRIKLYPDSVTSTCRLGLAVSVVYGDTTPNGTFTLSASAPCVKPNQAVDFTATATNPSFWASEVFLDSSATIGSTLASSTSTLMDGATTDYTSNQHSGRDVLVGDIPAGGQRKVTWRASWASEGVKTWQVDARSENWVDKSAAVQVTVDGTGPSNVGNLHSTSHTPGVWSSDQSIDFAWTPASDNVSGLQGYGYVMSTNPNATVGQIVDMGPVTTYSVVAANSPLPYTFKLRAVDNCDNWSNFTVPVSGFLIDSATPNAASNLHSTSHAVGVASCNGTIAMAWTAASDLTSGLAGYVGAWDHQPATVPVGALNLGAGSTSYTQAVGVNANDWYFHLRPQDLAGNWGPTVHAGPFAVDDSQWSTYCTAKVSSGLCIAGMHATGAASLSAPGVFRVTTDQLEPNKNGLTFFGVSGPASAPFQGGFLCVQSPVYRMAVKNTGGAGACSGSLAYTLADILAQPAGGGHVTAGTHVRLQTWYRDPLGTFSTCLSGGLEFLVCP